MMRNSASNLTTTGLKSQARIYRVQRQEAGEPTTHAQSLEWVAREHGFRDWNTAAAVLPQTLKSNLAIGQRISGTYLKQPFDGTIIAVAAIGAGELVRLTVQFDSPVDVVTFESFSAMRQRVVATVDRNGISQSRTSDGEPHMVISRI